MFNELISQKIKTDSGTRHGRCRAERDSGGETIEGGTEETGTAEVCVCGGGFSRKQVLLYYRCSIMCFSSYMVDDATAVGSNQLNKRKQHVVQKKKKKHFKPAK